MEWCGGGYGRNLFFLCHISGKQLGLSESLISLHSPKLREVGRCQMGKKGRGKMEVTVAEYFKPNKQIQYFFSCSTRGALPGLVTPLSAPGT